MDPDAFTASLFKWDPRAAVGPSNRLLDHVATPPAGAAVVTTTFSVRPRDLGGLENLFQAYGIRYYTASKIAELGFTVSTLLNMKDVELDDMMNSLSQIFRWDLLVGERYGIKAAVRAERRRLEDEMDSRRRHLLSADAANNDFDALSQEGRLSEEPVHQEKELIRSGGGPRDVIAASEKKNRRRRKGQKLLVDLDNDGNDVGEEDDDDVNGGNERQREHPFIVTEPGEVARGKKNGLDYLFHLYEQCHEFLIQVQNIAKDRGEKCPTKVTNQVFRYAKKAGASYINKPKMRHYVHCFALHCLDEEASNALRTAFKERGENVGAWREACYKPLVGVAARRGWDIDAIFNSHPRLAIWYVPTKLRQLCHSDRNSVATSSCVSNGRDLIPF